MCAAVAGAAVRRLRRWLYIAWAVIYIFAWVAWFLSFCISPLGLGSRPRPHLRDTVSSGPRREKECGRTPLLLCADPARPPPPWGLVHWFKPIGYRLKGSSFDHELP